MSPAWDQPSLSAAIIRALESMQNRLLDSKRTVDMISSEVSREAQFNNISRDDVRKSISTMQSLSQGGMVLDGDDINLLVSIEELKRRMGPGLPKPGMPLRMSKLINGKDSDNAGTEEH